MHYYSFHIGDYRAATAHLTNEEDLAYRRLLDWYYDTETPISLADTDRIARRLRVDVVVMERVLQDMFCIDADGNYRNFRADVELTSYHEKLQQASNAGKASAQRRLNARSTPVQQASNHTDTDTDKDKTPKAPLPKKRQRDPDESRGQRFTGPATLAECPAEWAALCKGLGWPFGRACIEYQNFVDYWSSVPGAKGRKLDWLATWRVRCRDQNKKNPAKPAYEPLPPVKFWVDDLLDPK